MAEANGHLDGANDKEIPADTDNNGEEHENVSNSDLGEEILLTTGEDNDVASTSQDSSKPDGNHAESKPDGDSKILIDNNGQENVETKSSSPAAPRGGKGALDMVDANSAEVTSQEETDDEGMAKQSKEVLRT